MFTRTRAGYLGFILVYFFKTLLSSFLSHSLPYMFDNNIDDDDDNDDDLCMTIILILLENVICVTQIIGSLIINKCKSKASCLVDGIALLA